MSEPKNLDLTLQGLWRENPIFVQMLGMCPTLAVSNSVSNALAMGLATTFVLLCSASLISLLRHWIPKEIRIASYILIIASFVTLAEYLLQAISLEIYNSLGAFTSLIVVNCILLGQAESFSGKNPLFPSLAHALGRGLGFCLAIVSLGCIREILGKGSFLGVSLFGSQFQPWVIFLLPSGGFFTLALLLILIHRFRKKEAHERG